MERQAKLKEAKDKKKYLAMLEKASEDIEPDKHYIKFITEQMNRQLSDMQDWSEKAEKLRQVDTDKLEAAFKAVIENDNTNKELQNKYVENLIDSVVAEIKSIEPKVDVKVPEVKTVIANPNPYDYYKPADINQDGNMKYYGYVAPNGKWFVMRETSNKDSKKYRYAAGNKDFKKFYGKRSSLDYKYYNELEL